MATSIGRSDGLRTIFSIFLGLMLTAFVGIGVFTFHPPPNESEPRLRAIQREEQSLREGKAVRELPEAEQRRVRELARERAALQDAAAEARKPWGRSTSVVLVVFATLIMALSLVRADELPVIANGLLLGGVFTMLYGVGWIVDSDASIARFVVMSVALVITLGLGYFRFVRRGATPSVVDGAVPTPFEGAGALEARIRDLEARMDDAARALGPRSDGPGSV